MCCGKFITLFCTLFKYIFKILIKINLGNKVSLRIYTLSSFNINLKLKLYVDS